MGAFRVSFLTPTYNRAHTLPRVWESLNRQDPERIEWVVVDDGSEDDTKSLVEGWAAQARFPVRYFHKQNGGKHSAVNLGTPLVSGQYTLVLDSDDALLDDAVDLIWRYVASTGIADLPGVAGLAFRCTDDAGNLRATGLSSETLQCSMSEAYYKHRIRDEWAVVFKTEIIRAMRFTELPTNEYVPESVTYAKLSKTYELIWVNHAIRRYYTNDGETRITDRDGKAEGSFKWPHGKYLRRRSVLNDEIEWFREDPAFFYRNAANMSRFGLHIGRSLRAQFGELSNGPAKLLWVAGLISGVRKYAKDRQRQASAMPPAAGLEGGN